MEDEDERLQVKSYNQENRKLFENGIQNGYIYYMNLNVINKKIINN